MAYSKRCLVGSIIVAFSIGAVSGFFAKPLVDTGVCKMRLASSSVNDTTENLPKSYKALGTIGPISVYRDVKNDSYIIGFDKCRGAVLMQDKTYNTTTLTLWGQRQEVKVSLTYDNATGKHIRSIFQTNAEGGLLAPTRWIYYDDDGDGQFESIVDGEHAKCYMQEGLKWIEKKRSPDNQSSAPNDKTTAGAQESKDSRSLPIESIEHSTIIAPKTQKEPRKQP